MSSRVIPLIGDGFGSGVDSVSLRSSSSPFIQASLVRSALKSDRDLTKHESRQPAIVKLEG